MPFDRNRFHQICKLKFSHALFSYFYRRLSLPNFYEFFTSARGAIALAAVPT